MLGWSKLSILVTFIRDLFFDTPDELNFKSTDFNTRKVVVFLTIIMLVSLSTFLINRSIVLVDRIKKLEQTCSSAATDKKDPHVPDTARLTPTPN